MLVGQLGGHGGDEMAYAGASGNLRAMQVADLLAPLGPVVTKPLLGGVGLYLDDRIFAIVHDDRVYFRTCAATIDRYLHAGAPSFVHHRDGGPDTVLPYREVPPAVLHDRDEACAWAYAAVAGD